MAKLKVELRKDSRGKFDELIARNCFFHAEMMSDGQLWIGVGDAKGKEWWSMWVTADGKKLDVVAGRDGP